MGEASDEQHLFPSREQLWQGVVLATIAHAIWVAPDSELAFVQGWDGVNYLLNDGSGDRATLTFTPEYVVAAFFDLHSERSPWRESPRFPFGSTYHAEDYFIGAPSAVQTIAQQQTLRYLFDDPNGQVRPTITAAFWSDGDNLTAREPWTKIIEHGAEIIANQTLPLEEAILAWTENYEFSDEQVGLLHGLFARWKAASSLIVMTAEERAILTAQGDAGLAETRELLAVVGIEVP